jgi:hypothetical protein
MAITMANAVELNEARFLRALEGGFLPIAPGRDGLADTRPVENPLTGRAYTGFEALFLKAHMKEQGLTTPAFLSMEELRAAVRETKSPGPLLRQDAKLCVLSCREERVNGKGEAFSVQVSRSFVSIEQTAQGAAIRQYAEVRRAPGPAPKDRAGAFPGRTAEAGRQNLKRQSFTCVSTDPAQVLGLYLAALETGRPFKISPVQYRDFAKKTRNVLNRPRPAQAPHPLVVLGKAALEAAAKIVIALASPAPAVSLGAGLGAGLGVKLASRRFAQGPGRQI